MANINPFSPDFKLSVCDGPALPAGHPNLKPGYVPCDFPHFVDQAQYLMEAAIVVGVLLAMISFAYSGYLYITGNPGNIDKAKDIFKKTGIGFIMMLSAWAVVYELLNWLGTSSFVTKLFGV